MGKRGGERGGRGEERERGGLCRQMYKKRLVLTKTVPTLTKRSLSTEWNKEGETEIDIQIDR